MNQRAFGRSGASVGEIGFGAWAIGGAAEVGGQQIGWSGVKEEDAVAAVRRAVNLGVTFFDTADRYGRGHSEEILAKALGTQRDRVFLATKGGFVDDPRDPNAKDFSFAHLERALEASLRRLRTDRVDLYQLHNPTADHVASGEIFDAMDRLRRSGKARFVGASLSRAREAVAMLEHGGRVDSLQVVYNVLNQKPATMLFPAAERAGVAIVARVPLASGLLGARYGAGHVFPPDDHRAHVYPPERLDSLASDLEDYRRLVHGVSDSPAQAALRFVLADPRVSVVIPGAKNPLQVEENVSATFAPLPRKTQDALVSRFRDVNLQDGP